MARTDDNLRPGAGEGALLAPLPLGCQPVELGRAGGCIAHGPHCVTRFGRSVAAAAAAAAASAAAATAAGHHGPRSRERGEQRGDRRGAAVGAADVVRLAPHELLERARAVCAQVLVDRHGGSIPAEASALGLTPCCRPGIRTGTGAHAQAHRRHRRRPRRHRCRRAPRRPSRPPRRGSRSGRLPPAPDRDPGHGASPTCAAPSRPVSIPTPASSTSPAGRASPRSTPRPGRGRASTRSRPSGPTAGPTSSRAPTPP